MLIKSEKSSYNIPPIKNTINDQSLGEMAYEDNEKCAILNQYFCSISKLDDDNDKTPDYEIKTDKGICNIYVEVSEIIDIINVLNPKKASGPDTFSHKMLKISPH